MDAFLSVAQTHCREQVWHGRMHISGNQVDLLIVSYASCTSRLCGLILV